MAGLASIIQVSRGGKFYTDNIQHPTASSDYIIGELAQPSQSRLSEATQSEY